jgi:chromosome segregation ATPase
MAVGKKEFTGFVATELEQLFISLGGKALEKTLEAFNEKKSEWDKAENEHQQRLSQLRTNQGDAERKTKAAEDKLPVLSEQIRAGREELAKIEAKIAELRPIADAYEATVRRHHEELARIAS